jgi:hypothetical protein
VGDAHEAARLTAIADPLRGVLHAAGLGVTGLLGNIIAA